MDYGRFKIKIGDKDYEYHFDDLGYTQAELAHEAALYKYDIAQAQVTPKTFGEILRSGAAEWQAMILQYLVRERKDDVLLPFDRNFADNKFMLLVQTELPIKNEKGKLNRNLIEALIADFFQNIGLNKNILSAFTSGNKQREVERTERLLSAMNTLLTLISTASNKDDQPSGENTNSSGD